MKVDIYKMSGVTIVKPHGDIRVKTVVPLRSNLEALDDEQVRKVAIDLEEVAFVDSSGVGLLANFAKRLNQRQGSMALFNYSADVKELLDVTGLEQAMGIHDDLDQMLAAMTDGGNEAS